LKTYLLVYSFLFFNITAAQDVDFDELLEPAIEDVVRFSNDYFKPGAEANILNMSSGWFQSTKPKEKFEFDISLVGNFSFTTSDDRTFLMDTDNYNVTTFESGPAAQNVATILGENDPDIRAIITVENPFGGTDPTLNLRLPQGIIGSASIVPSGYIQASLGLGSGFEVKARYFPKFSYKDIDSQFFGFAVQNNLTDWLNIKEDFNYNISALLGYTRFTGTYKLTSSRDINELDGLVESEANSFTFLANISTKKQKLNYFANLGFVAGNSTTTTRATGLYTFQGSTNSLEALIEIDPYDVEATVFDPRASVGASLNFGAFFVTADFTFMRFITSSLGVTYRFDFKNK